MSKSRRWITLILTLIALVLIGWNLTNQDDEGTPVGTDTQSPTYTSADSHTVVYNPQGALSYKLVSDKVTYFSDDALLAPGIKLKYSSPQGENERLPNPTLAVSDGSVTLKFHPHTLREIVASEQA